MSVYIRADTEGEDANRRNANLLGDFVNNHVVVRVADGGHAVGQEDNEIRPVLLALALCRFQCF